MLASTILLSALVAALAGAQPDTETQSRPIEASKWVNPDSGRSLLNYPPHRLADVRHLRLDLIIPDMNRRKLDGVATTTLEPIARPLGSLILNAAAMDVTSVECEGHATSFQLNPVLEELAITFDPPIPVGLRASVRIEFSVNEPSEGIIWTVESPAFAGRAAQLHTQGESDSARYWFPCHDAPNERFSSEVVITVPEGFAAVSNGKLLSHDSAAGTERFHWKQAREHVAYLLTLAVGKFDIVDVAPSGSAVPMPVYVPPGTADFVPATFKRTGEMMKLFERLFDEPFPWDKYAQVLVWNFAWGGMENTSATTLIDTTLLDRTSLLDGDEDSLISHELAHQWFGDFVTCRSWEHIWLNEGFATFSEKLWEQYRGSNSGTLVSNDDAYLWGILQDMENIVQNDRGDDAFEPAMQCKCYRHSIEVFEKATDPYSKGSAILHMLRERLGDEAFFKSLAAYLDRHAGRSVETYELRRAIEDTSGVSLQQFFTQWCTRPGVPRLTISHEWKSDEQTLAVSVEQMQEIDGDLPAFALSLPVWVRTAGGEQWVTIPIDGRVTEMAIPLDSEPQSVVFDPKLAVLAERRIERPEDSAAMLWLTQLRDGPTIAARIEAAEALAFAVAPRRPDSPPHGLIVAALDALVSVVENESLHYGLRQRAAKALGLLANPGASVDLADEARDATRPMTFPDRNAATALATLAQSDIKDARVRRVVIEQLARAAAPGGTTDNTTRVRVLSILSERLHRDESWRVRGAAVRGVGTMRAEDGLELIRKALNSDSFADGLRREALRAFADLDTPEAFGEAVRLSLHGNQQFTREAAAEAIAKLAHHDETSAIAALKAMLQDQEPRAKYAAAAALGEIGTPAARQALEEQKKACTSREFRHQMEKALAGAE